MDGVEVGAQPAQEAQQDEGEEEEEEGDRHRGVGDDLQWENVAVLRGAATTHRGQESVARQKAENSILHVIFLSPIPLAWRCP